MIPVFDGHNDTLLKLYRATNTGGRSFFERSDEGHIDLPRAREGGFAGGLFAIHLPPYPALAPAAPVPAPVVGSVPDLDLPLPLDLVYSQRTVMAMTASLFRMEAESEGQLKVVLTADELTACIRSGVLAAVLHFEGAESIDEQLDSLEVFYRAGLRSIGLVWSRPNAFAEGVPFKFGRSADTGPGLSSAGKDLVRACNRLGILIDLAHLNARGFWDVAELSNAPLVASHSNAHALCAATRNLTDDQLAAIRDSRGIVGVNFSVTFLREDGRWLADTPLDLVVRHIDYMVEKTGIDTIGFGSDFDGCTVPTEIGDVTGLPRVITALRDRGYDEASLRKLAHENWVRVLRETWKSDAAPVVPKTLP